MFSNNRMVGSPVSISIITIVGHTNTLILHKLSHQDTLRARWPCCDWKAWASCVQSFTLWQQTTIEFTRQDHSSIACSRHVYMV